MTPLTVGLMAQAIASAFTAGALLLLILTLLPATRTVARQLWPVLGSEATILAVGVLPWFLPPIGLLIAILAAAARVGYESGTVYGLLAAKDFRLSHALLSAAAGTLAWFAPTVPFLWLTVVLLAFALIVGARSSATSVAGCLARYTVFPLIPVAAFSHAASEPGSAPFLVVAFFLVEMFDSFSLLGGKLYGRTPLVPRISPRKTWEGFATGILAVLAALLFLVWLGLPLLAAVVAGVVVIVAAVAGDLLGSLAKRRAGVKDYPPVMTVQGGLLDIADAWLVAGPCLAGVASLLGWL